MEATANQILEFLPDKKKQKGPVKREFILDEDMKVLGQEIIRDKNIDVHPAKIEYVLIEPNISKSTAARCVKTNKELKFFSGLDFIIEVSAELWTSLDLETRKVLLEHELRHILVLQNDKTGDWKFTVRKHDVQDFGKIITDHGIEWIKRIKLCLSSLYDLTPAEEDKIQI